MAAFAAARERGDDFCGVAIRTENGSEYRFYEPEGFDAAEKGYLRAYDAEGRGKNGCLLAAFSGAHLAGTAATLLCAARKEIGK